jgi:fatty acid kinase
VHVHTSEVGAAIEAGIEAGRPYRVAVTPLAPVRPAPPVPGRRAVVAIVPGGALAGLFAGEGVRVVTCGPEDGAPDDGALDDGALDDGALDDGALDDAALEERVLGEIVASTATDVVVLPNDAALTPVAARAAARAREQDRDVAVVPTRSPVQGLAAVAVADPGRRFDDDVIAMAEAAAATRWAEVSTAGQEALTSAGPCRPGDVLGSAEGDVVIVGADLPAVACDLLDRLLSAGGEMATLVVGPDAALGDAVCAHLAAVHPTVEVVRYDGAAAVPLQVGVE